MQYPSLTEKQQDLFNRIVEHESKLDSYIKGSIPTTGWGGERNLNHFKLLDRVIYSYPEYCDFILTFDFKTALNNIREVINGEFTEFFSSQRRYITEKCIAKRISKIQKLIK